MTHYEFIFLIISSNDLDCYDKMRYFARNYFNLYNKKIKFFFIELREDINCDICEHNDFLFVKGKESICPGIYIKTIKSINYINENYNYDFLVRTNLSSFWNLKNLINLKNLLPLNNFAGGFIIFNTFISGTGIILSKDVSINIAKSLIISNEFEDVYISKLLINLGYQIINILQYRMEYLINDNACLTVSLNDIERGILATGFI